MADEADALAGAETEAASIEGAEGDETQQPRTVEDLASELGWKPKDQWKGDENGWQPAEDFLRAPREHRDNTKREIRGLRDQIDRLSSTSSRILEDTIAEKDAQLAAAQARAVEDGDNGAVDKIVAKRIELKNQAPAATTPGLPPETQEFVARHKFLETDPLARFRAAEVAQGLANMGKSVPEQLQAVERMLKKEFAEHFGPPAKQPAAVDTGRSRASGNSSKPKGYADMPAESQKMAQDYLARHGTPLVKFAESYWLDQDKKQRRAA